MDTFFDGIWRMDWGLGNPNKTAALIAMLMVAVWCLAGFRRLGFWVATLLFTGLGVCLMHTFSRGGLLAAIVGLLPLAWACGKRMTKYHWIAVACSVVIVIASAFVLNADRRFTQGIAGEEDLSITNRLEMWKVAPRMMLDAPSGWGIGNSGEAYMQWYQDPDKLEGYRTLVNSHLTWLVELGWGGRILYILGWACVGALLLPSQNNPLFAGAFGIWTSFFVSAFFSSVAESVWLWIPPMLALLVAICVRFRTSRWPRLPDLCVAFGCASLVVLLLVVWGASVLPPSGHPIRKDADIVLVGAAPIQVAILVNQTVMGRFYGKTWRKQVDPGAFGAATFVQSLEALPHTDESPALVIASKIPNESLVLPEEMRVSRLIVLNPRMTPFILPPTLHNRVFVMRGSFFNDPWMTAWDHLASSQVEVVQGAAEYLPEWPRLILGAINPSPPVQDQRIPPAETP
jgi:Lipid A core - O-antigen ligase and related enzymes